MSSTPPCAFENFQKYTADNDLVIVCVCMYVCMYVCVCMCVCVARRDMRFEDVRRSSVHDSIVRVCKSVCMCVCVCVISAPRLSDRGSKS